MDRILLPFRICVDAFQFIRVTASSWPMTGGAEDITLTANQIPAHSHPFLASTNIAHAAQGDARLLAQSSSTDLFIEGAPNTTMSPVAISAVGGSQPHTNFQPYLCVNFIISLFGIFPSPT
jgi:microcystin-dependent protein